MRKRKPGSENQDGAKDNPSPEYIAFEELAKKLFKAPKRDKKAKPKPIGS